MTAVLELHYLPCIAYFSLVQDFTEVWLERHEHYVKQSYRNRAYINTEHGSDALIVPLTDKHGKVRISDIRIDYGQKWVNNHWRSICSAYGKAPFFEYYADDLHDALFRKHVFLYDLNYELMTMCLRWLRFTTKVKETLTYEKSYADEIRDLRSCVNVKKSNYVAQIFAAVPYQQVFGNLFVENLSIVDLIFCCGPEASGIIKSSSRRE